MDFDLSSGPSDYHSNTEDLSRDPVSPTTMTTDLGLDPSDPLNLLLHNSAQGLDSMEPSKSAADWSQLAMLWPSSNDHHYLGDGVKYSDLAMDYNLSLPIAMDYNPSMAVDPSALHFESTYHTPSLFTSSLPVSPDFLPSSFPFTFRSDESSISSSNSERRVRRLSITSSSSSSGASFSPVIEPKIPKIENPADELAERVRQSAGVLLAVPTGVHGQAPQRPPQNSSKFSIPRLNRPKVTTKVKRHPPRSEPSSAASSPPPSDAHTSSPVLTSQPESSTANSTPPTAARPKTSHTTIERRYRTNLNARIQSLKQAVPALRVLEDKGRTRKDGEPVDVVDERGFVDGVKVARKCSKANVLGKAVEYIRVLKRREHRLIREQNGLKSLLSGLVGGPALLKEWETEWRVKFGGEETDEIEMDPVSEDDEGDDEDGDEASKDDEDEGRAKKKVKVAKVLKKPRKFVPPPVPVSAVLATASPDASFGNALPEKRKRGRPRKIPASSPTMGPEVVYTTNVLTSEIFVSATNPVNSGASEPVGNRGQASHYLLATFALFSFLNSPLTQAVPRPSSQPHTGVVLGHIHAQQPLPVPVDNDYTWQGIIQAFHLLVSILVFCSILAPWLPTMIRRTKFVSYLLSPISWLLITDAMKLNASTAVSSSPGANLDGQASAVGHDHLMDALDTSRRGTSNEADRIRSALNVSTGLAGLVSGMFRKTISKEHSFEHQGLIQRAWVRLGELAVLDGSTSLAYNLYTYWHMQSHLSWFSASPSDLSTLALLIYRISGSKGASLWNRAKNAQLLRSHEKLVLESLTVDEAVARLTSRSGSDQELDKYGPIGVLAYIVIREKIKQHAAALFVRTVVQGQSCDWQDSDVGGEFIEEERVMINAAKSLGGRTGSLGEMLERVWKMDVGSFKDVERAFEIDGKPVADLMEEGIKSLLKAVVLYKRIFPAPLVSRPSGGTNGVCILLSPPPSPSRKTSKLHLALRRVLGSSVFDCSDFPITTDDGCDRAGITLDDARDRVVDMLMDLESQMRCSIKRGDAVY